MTATFRINQNSVNGTWGLARTNLELFSVSGSVTLEAQDTHATYLWEIIGNIDGSTGVLSSSTAQVTTIDMDEEGTLIIRLTVDAAISLTKDIQELAVGIPLPNSGLPIPGARETIQDNQFTGVNAGWQVKIERFLKWVDANFGGVTAHSALTGLTSGDDHTQYLFLDGRSGGQVGIGGTVATDSLELQATSGVGASGSNVDVLVGNDGAILAIRADYTGLVGIGTSTPLFRLSVGDDGGIAALGTYGSGLDLPSGYTGAGTRMLWYPKKAAFRVGYVSGTQWDESNIGGYSAAFGDRTIARGISSFASGSQAQATSVSSTAIGNTCIASGASSVAMGNSCQASNAATVALGGISIASGDTSVAIGNRATASGVVAVAIGNGVTASGAASLATGKDTTTSGDYSVALGQGITVSGDNTVGIALDDEGSTTCAQNNSMCIMGGKVGIETVTPDTELHVLGDTTLEGNILLDDGDQVAGKVLKCASGTTGAGGWGVPTPIVEVAVNTSLTYQNHTVIVTVSTATVTLPSTGLEDGHEFVIKNATGDDGAGAVAVEIAGTTIKFDTYLASASLTTDGWVLKCSWSATAATYWITLYQMVHATVAPV